jgi:hypothetical protein
MLIKTYFSDNNKRVQQISAVLVVVIIAAVGTYLLVGSHAATPYASINAVSGTLANGATKQTCSGAIGGNCVVFGRSIPMDGNVALALGTPGTPFAANSFWNTPLPNNTPVNTDSAAYVSSIPGNTSLATSGYSAPLYVVPADQPCVPIILNAASNNHSSAIPTLQTQLSQGQGQCHGVPIPTDAHPAAGSDAHISVYQPSSNTLWEFWRLSTPTNNAPGAAALPWSSGTVPSYGDNQWHTVWGGVLNNVSTSEGVFSNSTGGTATGLSLLGIVERIEELQAGQINHVMGLILPNNLSESVIPANNCPASPAVNTPGVSWGVSWPANRSDGNSTNQCAIPEGLRFRLPSGLNLTQYNLTPIAMAIAVAAQKYGFVVSDSGATGNTPNIVLGDPTTYTTAGLPNPYTSGPGVGGVNNGNKGLLDGTFSSSVIMHNFPWDQLEALPFNYGGP